MPTRLIVSLPNSPLVDPRSAQRTYKFAEKHELDLFFVSAADGTNVVKIFEEILDRANEFKKNPTDDYLLYEMMDGEDELFTDL